MYTLETCFNNNNNNNNNIDIYIYIYIWVNYNDLTATSLEIIVSKGNHPKMALIQVSEIL